MKRGILYIICIIALIIMNVLYVDYEFFIILLMVLIVPAISWLLFIGSVTGLKMYINPEKRHLTLGDSVALKVWSANKKCLLVGKHRVTLNLEYANDSDGKKGIKECIQVVKGTTNIDYKPTHCGILQVNIKQVRIEDYTGIFAVNRKYWGSCQIAVFPKMIYSNCKNSAVNKERPYQYSMITEEDTDIVDLRSFRPGDKMNRIHWKLSLRTDDLIVRQYGEEIQVHKNILVDLSVGDSDIYRDNLDLVYQNVYSIANLYIENGLAISLAVWNTFVNKIERFQIVTQDELDKAMFHIMELPYIKEGTEELIRLYKTDFREYSEHTVLITASDYDNKSMLVVNVNEISVQDIVNYLWEKM